MKVIKSVQFEDNEVEILGKAFQMIAGISDALEMREDDIFFRMLDHYNGMGKFEPKDNTVNFANPYAKY